MSEHALIIRKHLPAAPAVVFDAWTTPAHMANWLSPMTSASVPRLDLRVGGEFQIDMHGEEKSYVHTGKYLEIDRPNKLVFTWVSEGTQQEETVVTIELQEKAGGTELTLTHERFPSAKAKENHNQGWTAIVEKLERVLSGDAAASA